MEQIYIIVFVIGVLYTFVSLLISGISGAFHLGNADTGHIGHIDCGSHIGGHIDASGMNHGHIGGLNHAHVGGDVSAHGHAGDLHGHADSSVNHSAGTGSAVISIFSILINPIVAVSFLTVFGGIGILATNYSTWTVMLIFITAIASGVIVSTLLYRFVAVPLYKSENSTHVSRDELIGKPAEVISDILENGYGEIKYVINSIMYTAPAKHIECKTVKQGKKVAICKIEQNVFYVAEIEDF